MNTLERLKDLDAKATRGPWFVNENPRRENEEGAVEFDNPHGRTAIFLGDCFWNLSDATLIAETRNALPKLLAFVVAWDDCQIPSADRMAKMCALLSARKALDEETK